MMRLTLERRVMIDGGDEECDEVTAGNLGLLRGISGKEFNDPRLIDGSRCLVLFEINNYFNPCFLARERLGHCALKGKQSGEDCEDDK